MTTPPTDRVALATGSPSMKSARATGNPIIVQLPR